MRKKRKMRQVMAGVISILLVAIMIVSMFAPGITASAKNTPAIIYMDNNKQHYEIGEEITFGVGLPEGVTSFEFTMGYSSSCLEMETQYEENRVSVQGNYFKIKAKVVGNGKLYFKVTNVSASNGYPYGSASILRYAGNGQEQEEQKISECLLSELSVDNGTLSPDFDKYVDNYWIDIGEKEKVSITAKTKEANDKITIKKNGEEVDAENIPIKTEMETIDVIVSTEGNEKTYSLFVKRIVPEEPEEPGWEEPEQPEEPEEKPDEPTEVPPKEEPEKPKFELPFSPVVAVIIILVSGGIIALIVIGQLKQSKKEYDMSDEAYRIREEKERQKRVEQMRKERMGEDINESEKKGLFGKKKK